MSLDPWHIIWTRALLDGLTINGTWGVPSSGTIFKKIANGTVEIERSGNNPKLLAAMIEHIEAAGYVVSNPPGHHSGNGKHRRKP
jgi:hypothetical protein